jgi:hypothetical protein
MQPIPHESLIYGQEYLIEHYGPEGLLSKTRGTLHDDGPLLYRFKNVVEFKNGVETPVAWFHTPRIIYDKTGDYWLFYIPEKRILKRKQELCEAKIELPNTVFYH